MPDGGAKMATKPILKPDQIDNLAKAVLTLTHELWAMKDRQMILEAVLDKHGIKAAEEVDKLVPDEALAKKLAEERSAFAERVMRAIRGDHDTSGWGLTDHATPLEQMTSAQDRKW